MRSPIVEFVLERISEDEGRATRALGPADPTPPLSGHWRVRTGETWQWDVVDASGRDVVYLQPGEGGGAVTEQVADHIAGQDPVRALAEARLKRGILSAHDPCCSADLAPCEVVLAVAAVYRRHPDWAAVVGTGAHRLDPVAP